MRDAAFDPGYRLTVTGPARTVSLDLAELAALPQHTVVLPIACVEGWSSTGTWSGVRLRDLVALVGADPENAEAYVESLEARGRYRATTVPPRTSGTLTRSSRCDSAGRSCIPTTATRPA